MVISLDPQYYIIITGTYRPVILIGHIKNKPDTQTVYMFSFVKKWIHIFCNYLVTLPMFPLDMSSFTELGMR